MSHPNQEEQVRELDKTQLGQLIAEVQKFGGMDKTKATQFVNILMPHIKELVEQETRAAREAECQYWIDEFTQAQVQYSADESLVLTPSKVEHFIALDSIEERLTELRGEKNE